MVTLAGLGTIRQGLTEAGPYAAGITPADGLPHPSYVLTMTGIPRPLPGFVKGDATRLWPVLKDGAPGVVSATIPLDDGADDLLPVVEIGVGPALTDIDKSTSVIQSGSLAGVYVPVTGKDSESGEVADLSEALVRLALTLNLPVDSDYQAGSWLTRTDSASGTDKFFARLALPPERTAILLRGKYWVYVEVAIGGQVYRQRCPGRVSVAL